MKKVSYLDALMWSSQIGWWTGTVIGATAIAFIVGPSAIFLSLIIGGMGSAIIIAGVNDLYQQNKSFWKEGKNRTFKMVATESSAIGTTVDAYTRVGFFWVFIAGDFESGLEAQEYITSKREVPARPKEIGKFKA